MAIHQVARREEVSDEPSTLRLLGRMLFHMLVHTIWISLLFPIAVISALVHPKSGGVWVARLIWSPVLLWIGRAKLHVEGRENVDPKRPTIYVANHQSTLDIPVTLMALPVNFRYVAKSQLKWVPILGWYLWLAGHVFVDRGNRKQAISSLDKAARRIRKGTSIVMYPEGTRSDGRILPFKKGPFALALKAGVAIVPVTIEGTARVMPKNSWKVSLGEDIYVKIGQPIDTSTYAPHERERLMRDVRNVIIQQSLAIGGQGGDRDDVVAAVGQEGVGRGAEKAS